MSKKKKLIGNEYLLFIEVMLHKFNFGDKEFIEWKDFKKTWMDIYGEKNNKKMAK